MARLPKDCDTLADERSVDGGFWGGQGGCALGSSDPVGQRYAGCLARLHHNQSGGTGVTQRVVMLEANAEML